MPTILILGSAHAYELTRASNSVRTRPETLVFVHGWLLSRAYWQPLVNSLSADYSCLTYDLRGFGESAALESAQSLLNPMRLQASDVLSRYSLAAYAQDLESLLDCLKIDQVWLIGHSLGGSVALWAAYLFPHRIKGVICVNSGGGIYIEQAFKKFRAAGERMVKFRPSWLERLPLLPQVFSRMMVNRPLGTEWGKQRIHDFVQADQSAAKNALLSSTTEAEVHQLPLLMGQLMQPVHFITASKDTIMPPQYVRHLASFHPQFVEEESVTELLDCGHMAMVEQPEAVEKVVRFVVMNSELQSDD